MPILHNCEVWFLRANPARPNAKFDKKNPSWEVQIRTRDRAQKNAWEAMGLKPKAVIPDDGSAPYYKTTLRKRTIKADGEKASPVKVTNGSLEDLDPDTVGNGSIANIRVFQYEYTSGDNSGTANVLMALQVTKHIHYKPQKRDDEFEMTETEEVPLEEAPDEIRNAQGGENPDAPEGHEGGEGQPEDPPFDVDEPAAPAPAPKPAASKAAAPKPAAPAAPKAPAATAAPRTAGKANF